MQHHYCPVRGGRVLPNTLNEPKSATVLSSGRLQPSHYASFYNGLEAARCGRSV